MWSYIQRKQTRFFRVLYDKNKVFGRYPVRFFRLGKKTDRESTHEETAKENETTEGEEEEYDPLVF